MSGFSTILKELRTERSLSQKDLAEKLNYTQSNISEWEKGTVEPKAAALIALSAYFDVSIEYLLGLEDDFGVRVDDKEKKPDVLSAEERRLLEGYREINAAGKKLVIQTVETLRNTAAGSGSGTENKIG